MTEATPQPSDAILGGQAPPPTTGAILGGLAGAEQRLKSESLAARLAALKESFQYGEDGIDLASQALQDPEAVMRKLAYRLLREEGSDRAKQALLTYDPLKYFTTLEDWRLEIYNSAVGITDPQNNAYAIRMTNSGRSSRRATQPIYGLSQFEALLQDPRLPELEALIFQIDDNYWDSSSDIFSAALNAVCQAHEQLPNLKALFIGDSEGDRAPAFRKSKLFVSDIRPLLEAFPKLEVLHVFGCFGSYHDYTLSCAGLRHDHLKTLVIETADITGANINQLCSMDLPALEYFELWFGRRYSYDSALPYLKPIFEGKVYPKLQYLGLCSSEEINALVQQLVQSPLMSQLIALDLNMSGPDEEGYYGEDYPSLNLQPLKDPAIVENLQVLNLSGMLYGATTIAELSQNIPQVIALGQDGGYFFEDYTSNELEGDEESYRLSRHCALYE